MRLFDRMRQIFGLAMIGTKLAHYEITMHLGSGGMGDVYQATDTKLGRNVAIKFLPEVFSQDTERVARFQREARVLASLTHPNIAAIHGLEESGGRTFLVLELVHGETLSERIARGPVALDDAVRVAVQIADALAAAHSKGIVHRDLKPANIKIGANGSVKVLDFGLAKVHAPDGNDASNWPTQVTEYSSGPIIGTPAYMSPEQVKGLETDRTTDVWAFGCVLYEMLTGRRAFGGGNVSEILAEVLKTEPDWSRIPSEIPEGVQRLLRRCLQKQTRARLHDFSDVRIELEDLQRIPSTAGPPERTVSRGRLRIAWTAALVFMVVAMFAMVMALRKPSASAETHLDIATPPAGNPASIALSPDGRKIVYEASSPDGLRLWLRSMDSATARSLAGTEGGTLPFWSPDNRSIGFFAQSKLKRIEVDTGSVQTLADVTLSPSGGTWGADGTIVFAPSLSAGLFRISENGGPAIQVLSHGLNPRFLPNGREFLFTQEIARTVDFGETHVGSLDGSDVRRLSTRYVIPVSKDRVLFLHERTLFTQSFDMERLELLGKPTIMAERVAVSADGFSVAVSASPTGTIIYRTTGDVNRQTRQIIRFDRTGREIEKMGALGGFSPTVSPDGRFMAVSRLDGKNNIWLLEIARGVITPFTADPVGAQTPLWSPDGRYVVFSSARTGVVELYKRLVAGGRDDEPVLLNYPNNKVATDWSSDGEFLLYRSNDPKTSYDIWALPMRTQDPTPIEVVRTEFGERDAQFSPDAKWIAYESNRSGRSEIYVRPFRRPGPEQQISVNGGAQVRWNRDGKELFYIALDGRLMTVPVRLDPDGQTIEARAPVRLFMTRMGDPVQTTHKQQYVVSPDGQEFLMSTVVDEGDSLISVILNWHPERGK